jgi:superfamily II DNA or RNA helicase
MEEVFDGNVKITVEKLNEVYIRCFSDISTKQELSDYFTFEVPGARWSPKYKARIWDGKIRLYNMQKNTLYVGLFPYVKKFAETRGYNVEVVESNYGVPVKEHNLTDKDVSDYVNELNTPLTIRDYQLESVTKALNDERIVLESPTASGKSFIIYCIMRWYLEQGKKCIIIVPTTSLVEQMYSDFDSYGEQSGWRSSNFCQRIYAGHTKETTSPVVISTWQSIYKLPRQWFNQFTVFFGDEAHQFKAKSLVDVMEKMTDIPVRIGTTGTLDNKQVHKLVLEGLFGPVYKVVSTKQLMDTQQVASLSIKCIMLKYDEEIRKINKKMEYQDEMNFLITNEKRNKFIRNLAVSCEGNTLLLFQYVEKHGKVLNDMITKVAGDRKVFFIHGGVDTEERELVRKICEKTTDSIIIASFGTFSTGVNIPSIQNIIFASPTKSKIRNLQSIGRGLRLSDGKETCKLFDIADDLHWKSWKNHTLNHFIERVAIYNKEQFKYKVIEVDL